MSLRKQQLLRQHRKNKRFAMLGLVVLIGLCTALLSVWCLPLGLLLVWIIHEAWFADHIFYAASDDYQYSFPEAAQCLALPLRDGVLKLPDGVQLQVDDTLILQVRISSRWLGRWFDPSVQVGADRQTFERGAKGIRYLNLTGQLAQLRTGLAITGRYCYLSADVKLWAFSAPELANKKIMILAPHADDAELAAFGLYSQNVGNVSIITLTQGEIEAEHYQNMGLEPQAAARLKGRLRAWDSLAIPLWGGVRQENCVQLGYYCLQLPAMRAAPEQAFGSRESGEADVRRVRGHNPLALPADQDGLPSWNNLVADLTACLQHFKPQVVLMPHPELDPHSDHIATGQAFYQALEQVEEKPELLLLYANHLHDNDRWPMGDAGAGVALPPAMEPLPALPLFSHVLSPEQQLDKAMSLQMQHDLQPPLAIKKRIRRLIQQVLTGRRWPKTGDNEFMRKAVRRHEVFWVRDLGQE